MRTEPIETPSPGAAVQVVHQPMPSAHSESHVQLAISAIARVIQQGHCVVALLSGGKDSSCVTALAVEAIRRLKQEGYLMAPHYVSSSSTGIENPEIEHNLQEQQAAIESFCARHSLAVQVKTVYPSLSKTFQVATIGRGTLPRFVENGAKHRSCSVDWKVVPQQRLASELRATSQASGYRETVSLLGTRFDESTQRGSNMRRRGEEAALPVRGANGYLTLSPIADWTEAMVWDFLSSFLLPELQPFESYLGPVEVRRLLDVYRSANDGVCGMFMADGAKAPCGSRFGCFACTLTGERDRSMESLLASDPKFGYMAGLNQFRQYLIATQWDMSTRELIGRTLSPAGYLPVRPDVYNLAMRRRLLQYMLTLDAQERERAQAVQDALEEGRMERDEHTERMAEPQFELVSYSQLVLIDFYWSIHHAAFEAFPALSIWYDVAVLGRRYPVPTLQTATKTEIGAKRWFKVGQYDAQFPTDGLRDYLAEAWNPYRHPEREQAYREIGGERVVWFETDKRLDVDAAAALLFVEGLRTSDILIRARLHSAIESARFWLNEGFITLPQTVVGKYLEMARRGQYFSRLIDVENLTPAEVDTHLRVQSITDKEHEVLLANMSEPEDGRGRPARWISQPGLATHAGPPDLFSGLYDEEEATDIDGDPGEGQAPWLSELGQDPATSDEALGLGPALV